MRRARIKPEDRSLYYHLYNRVAGEPDYRPFGPKEKEHFVRLLHKLQKLFTIRIVSYTVMSNHFHLVAYAPEHTPSPEEVCRRYNAYYGGRKKLDVDDPRVENLAARMRDISEFMHDLQQQFSTWFNKSRPTRRRGTLWADRFKHTLLGDGRAVWECIKYIEMNPVRAFMVKTPADYRFCSFGVWSASGRHPFEENVEEVLMPCLEVIYPYQSIKQLHASLSDTFAEMQGVHEKPDGKVIRFALKIDRRMRYWTDGLVIGSELFVKDMISKYPPHLRRKRSGISRSDGSGALCCYKQLRSI